MSQLIDRGSQNTNFSYENVFTNCINQRDTVAQEKEKRIRKAFLSLLTNDQTDTFHSPPTIRRLLDDPSQPHSYAFFLNRVNKLMRAWVSQVFQSETITGIALSSVKTPKLEPARETENAQDRALKKLQRSRARLNENVEDPLAEAVAAASRARRSRKRKQPEPIPSEENSENEESDENNSGEGRAFTGRIKTIKKKKHKRSPIARGTMLEKKKSATRLEFTPEKGSDSENIEDPDQEDDVLPDVKKRAKAASPSPSKKLKSQEKMYDGRRAWTDAEKNAVKEGISRFGLGKWAVVKKEYFMTLKFRTSGQIKVRIDELRCELADLLLECSVVILHLN